MSQRSLPAYHPVTNQLLGDVTVVDERKVYPAWLKPDQAGQALAVLPGWHGNKFVSQTSSWAVD